MDFNRYVFDCYLATESAKKTKGFFDDLPNYIHKKSVHEMYSFLSQQSYTRETKEYWEETILFANNLLQDFQDWDKAQDIDQAIDHYDHLINLFLSEDNKKEYDDLVSIKGKLYRSLNDKIDSKAIILSFKNRFFNIYR